MITSPVDSDSADHLLKPVGGRERMARWKDPTERGRQRMAGWREIPYVERAGESVTGWSKPYIPGKR